VDESFSKDDFNYHSHNMYEIYYFHSGDCKYLIGNRIYQLEQDDIIIMNGLTLHRANPIPTKPYERSIIEFSPEWIKHILKTLKVPELLDPFNFLSNSIFRGGDEKTLQEINRLFISINQLTSSIHQEGRSKKDNGIKEAEITSMFIQLLIKVYEISQFELGKTQIVDSEKEHHVNRIKSWIDENFQDAITLDIVSNHLNISKYYMSRIFKDVTGYTIMQYIMSCRIDRAKYLLEIYPDKSIQDVAIESGFENASHFSRLFRKQVNISPSEYRNKKAVVE